jgi:hypothetical protein
LLLSDLIWNATSQSLPNFAYTLVTVKCFFGGVFRSHLKQNPDVVLNIWPIFSWSLYLRALFSLSLIWLGAWPGSCPQIDNVSRSFVLFFVKFRIAKFRFHSSTGSWSNFSFFDFKLKKSNLQLYIWGSSGKNGTVRGFFNDRYRQ